MTGRGSRPFEDKLLIAPFLELKPMCITLKYLLYLLLIAPFLELKRA